MATEVFHLYYTPAANAATMIKPALSVDAQVAVTAAAQTGIDLTAADAGGNSHATEDMLVVTDYTDNLDKVRKIIKEVDRRPQQVLVEATILAATVNDNNALGVDFSVLGGVKLDQFMASPSQTNANAANATLTDPSGAGGTTLVFRPFVGDDDYVRMEIHPEDSAGGLTASNLPFKSVTEVTTNMMVKDGRTIVIGGLFREASSTSRAQVPGVGNLPLLGALFRQQTDQTQRQEIIVLLTPHILKDDSSYDKLSEETKKRLEAFRIGVRKGMMPFGRERLAELSYENAIHELAKPDADRNLVLWHLNAATNLNPTFVEAIELKAKISGRRVTESNNSLIRHFVSQAIVGSAGTALPPASPGVRMP